MLSFVDNKLKPSNENREERNNRRNKEGGNADDKAFQRRPGQNSGRRFDGRGKREFDRQSGSEKTGVKAIDKKDGAGAHNWGSAKQDAEEYNKLQDLNGELSGDDKPKEPTEPKGGM
jgi:plasminogen activator inhibitor 1 RNA-binding protein